VLGPLALELLEEGEAALARRLPARAERLLGFFLQCGIFDVRQERASFR
jgi:hypothetical protein